MAGTKGTRIMEWINWDCKVRLADTGTAYVVTRHVPHKKVVLMGTWDYTADTQRAAKGAAMAYASRVGVWRDTQ